jgi:hypothetical protein
MDGSVKNMAMPQAKHKKSSEYFGDRREIGDIPNASEHGSSLYY